MALTHITDIDRFFKYQDNKLIFTGNSLVVKISKRWEVYGYLQISDTVQTIGIMDMIIDEKYNANLHLIAYITMRPTIIDYEMINDINYMVLTFYNGDIFLENTSIVKTQAFVYVLFKEYIDRGKTIYTMDYSDMLTLFDTSKEICDASLSADHAIFEVIYAHTGRSKKDPNKFYRHTKMDPEDYLQIPLGNFALSADSTTSRLLGSYLSNTLLAAINSEDTEDFIFEDLLRGKQVTADT